MAPPPQGCVPLLAQEPPVVGPDGLARAKVSLGALLRLGKEPRFWLQLRLQLPLFAAVRTYSRPVKAAGEEAYGTAVNRYERDQLGLAVCGSGVRIPSAPPANVCSKPQRI